MTVVTAYPNPGTHKESPLLSTHVAGICDLCERYTTERRFEGTSFDMEGWICSPCVAEVRAEQDDARHQEQFRNADLRHPDAVIRANELLEIVGDRYFRVPDLTRRTVGRIEVSAARRRARRKPKAQAPPPIAGPPCVKCGTTGGHLDRSKKRPLRTEGAKYGSPGKHCATCFGRIYRPTTLRLRIGGAA